jgi:SAM-dependent methyltransferase
MPADLSAEFNYCELGCGQGFSTALLAAANPTGKFWGIDFNPAHMAGANQLKTAASIGNVTFLEKSFAELGAAGLPEFDFIALHGVWSWIARENRDAIVAFIYEKLKPGGIVYISYNAQPGWAAIAPLRQLMVESQRHKSEMDAAGVGEAIALAAKMRSIEAGYFKANPAAGANLDLITKMGRNYLMHEYFNRDWAPFYFSEVANDLRVAKLGFACSCDVLEQIDQLCISKEAQNVLGTLRDAVARETIRDYFRNQRFRRDIFTRGSRFLGNTERTEMLRQARLAAAPASGDLPGTVNFPAGGVSLTSPIYAAITDHLRRGPSTLGELFDVLGPKLGGFQNVFQAAMVLMAAGRILPALSDKNEQRRKESTHHFNRTILMQPLGLESQTLASPVTGNGVAVPRIDQFFLSLEQHGRNLTPGEVMRRMSQQGMKMTQKGDTIGKPDELLDAVKKSLDEFRTLRLPAYHNLGIV